MSSKSLHPGKHIVWPKLWLNILCHGSAERQCTMSVFKKVYKETYMGWFLSLLMIVFSIRKVVLL